MLRLLWTVFRQDAFLIVPSELLTFFYDPILTQNENIVINVTIRKYDEKYAFPTVENDIY